MPKLSINFNDVPDKIPPIPQGPYTVEVTEVPKIEPSKKGDSMNVVFNMRIVEHPDPLINGRFVTHYVNLGKNPESKIRAEILLKKMCASAGITVGPDGVMTEEFLGKRMKALLAPRTYQDDDGVQQDSTQVKGYIV